MKTQLLQHKKVLFVDDDENTAHSVKRWLKLHAIQCHVTTKAQELTRFAKRFRPDLILLDLHMPQISGLSLLKRLKKRKDLKDIPVIMLTGNTDNTLALESINLGARGYVAKSHMVKDLIPMIYEYA
ncbi:response regulator [bacterium]|nr:response regulator [bacterium]